MHLSIRRTLIFDAPRELVYAVITDPENLSTFTGFGPIPGIVRAEYTGEVREGSELLVHNTDGSTHHERIEIKQPGVCYRIRIDRMDSPFRFIVDHAIERLDFEERDGRTFVAREFRFALTSPLCWPLAAPLLNLFFGRALDRNYERLRALIASRAAP